ncbi:PWWP domain-containing DNA repair factor 3B-like isoform X2 [Antennarius striatus]|uniref:PWWP domain-containing DNA repair factor 3B-like isoform X2 n=1 Tax=Antennarius striatus TaxID=241820 RepID=UPI0035AEE0EB
MKGGPWTRQRTLKNTTKEKKSASDAVACQATGESKAVSVDDTSMSSQSAKSSIRRVSRRDKGHVEQTRGTRRTFSPVRSSSPHILSDFSKPPSGEKEMGPQYTEFTTPLKTSEVASSCSELPPQSRCRSSRVSQPRQVRQRSAKEKTVTCMKNKAPLVKNRRGRPRKIKTEATACQSYKRSRPRFELTKLDTPEKDESSDLSLDLGHHEEQEASFSFQEDEESDEEEEDLPSFLKHQDKKPQSITEGMFVWHKFRNYPFWPALVKSVNRRQRKASILFIDDPEFHKKGFVVALKVLKPFDCEEANELVCKAKEKFQAAIEWSLELITDYRIRIACGSFSDSFIKYFAHNMSYPVRRKYPQATSQQLTIASDELVETPSDNHNEDSFSEQQEEVSSSSKRLLPDRSHAAHNRANEKLVHFIVKQRMVEKRLLAVIRRQQQSRWLRSFLSADRRRVVNVYLEDDQQLDQVYTYLNELYSMAVTTDPHLAEVMERVRFVLDVLLPESVTALVLVFCAGHHLCYSWGGQCLGYTGRRKVLEGTMYESQRKTSI